MRVLRESWAMGRSRGQHILDFETEVKLLERIGSGAFGDVYRGLFQGEEVAVKMFGGRLHSAEATATFEREAGLLSWYVRHRWLRLA